jgi:hypothetical protein
MVTDGPLRNPGARGGFRCLASSFGEATFVTMLGLVVNMASVFLLSSGHGHQPRYGHRDDHEPNSCM